jgi:hypothetical protein
LPFMSEWFFPMCLLSFIYKLSSSVCLWPFMSEYPSLCLCYPHKWIVRPSLFVALQEWMVILIVYVVLRVILLNVCVTFHEWIVLNVFVVLYELMVHSMCLWAFMSEWSPSMCLWPFMSEWSYPCTLHGWMAPSIYMFVDLHEWIVPLNVFVLFINE